MIPNDIDTRAPVVARYSTVIDAPLGMLWRLHTDVDAWPAWQPDIETARLEGPFAPARPSRGTPAASTSTRPSTGSNPKWMCGGQAPCVNYSIWA